MSVFGTPGRLVSWAKRCPQTRQSGKKSAAKSPGKGDPWLNGPLGEIAASASRTDTFLGERAAQARYTEFGGDKLPRSGRDRPPKSVYLYRMALPCRSRRRRPPLPL
jgi:Transposase IS116/IS110/IS902 family